MAIKFVKRFIKFLMFSILFLLIIFAILFQRDLNKKSKIVDSKISESVTGKEATPGKFVLAFNFLFSQDSSHYTYVGYLFDHDLSFKNEPINLMSTRMISYGLMADLNAHLEIDYHVHNLDRLQKINFIFNESGKKVYQSYEDLAFKFFKKSVKNTEICENIILISSSFFGYMSLEDAVKNIDLAKIAGMDRSISQFCDEYYN